MSTLFHYLSSRLPRGTQGAKSRADLYFCREAKARDAVEGSLLNGSPLVAEALLFTLRNEGPVRLRSILSNKHSSPPEQAVSLGANLPQ
jgi:hypothetical protein